VLDPQLAPGQSRELTVDEIARLVPYFNWGEFLWIIIKI
jgi:hypothetical protein